MPLTAPAGIPQRLRLPRRPAMPAVPAVLSPVPAPGPLVTAPAMLPGNLLAPADSDFESALTGHWAAVSNCSLALGTAQSFSGAQSLACTATAGGASSFNYGPGLTVLAFPALSPLVLSLYLFTPLAGRTGQLSVSWLSAGLANLGNPAGAAVSLTAGAWTPLTLALASPAGTAFFKITVSLTGQAAGEAILADLVYAALSEVQVLAAWPSAPLASSPLFCDMTPFTRVDQPVTITRGRPDEVSECQAGTATLTFDNMVGPGWFSQGNPGSPFDPQVGTRMQVNMADEVGGWHTRFDGYFTDLGPAWQGGPALSSTVAVSASDILAWVARQPQLRTILEQEQLLDSPVYQWPLGDQSVSLVAAELSGNNGPVLAQKSYGSGGSMSFGASDGPVGSAVAGLTQSPISAASFTPAASYGGAVQLEAKLAGLTAAAGFSAEIWLKFDTTAVTNCVAFALGSQASGAQIYVVFSFGSPLIQWTVQYLPLSPGAPVIIGGGNAPGPDCQVVINVSGTTAAVGFNGSAPANVTIPAGFNPDHVVTAGPFRGPNAASSLGGWAGTLNCAAIYPSVLSAARIAAHYTAGIEENLGTQLVTMIANLATYIDVPSYALAALPSSGVSYADAWDFAGQTPLSTFQAYEHADGGVLYTNAAGQLAYQDRAARYAAVANPVITLAAGQYEPDLSPKSTDQYLINDDTLANYTLPGGVRAQNAASIAARQRYQPNSPASPLQAPYYAYPYQSGSPTPSPDVLGDAASWLTGIYGTPQPRPPDVTIDLRTQPASEFSRATAYQIEIGTAVQRAGMPSTAPAGPLPNLDMVEGIAETYQRDEETAVWTLALNTTPASAAAAWIAGHPVLGVLDSTAVVGRGTDGASGSPGTISQYAGAPYPVPAFSPTMNRTGNVGANDMRGLAANVQQMVTPPLAIAQQAVSVQSVSSAVNTDVKWDTYLADTASGLAPTASTIYTVEVAGQYVFAAVVAFAANSTGDRRAWIQQNGAQVSGSVNNQNAGTDACFLFVTCELTCAVGDQIKVTCFQNSGGPLNLVTTNGGCCLSVLWIGT